jgi:hypothetical protein
MALLNVAMTEVMTVVMIADMTTVLLPRCTIALPTMIEDMTVVHQADMIAVSIVAHPQLVTMIASQCLMTDVHLLPDSMIDVSVVVRPLLDLTSATNENHMETEDRHHISLKLNTILQNTILYSTQLSFSLPTSTFQQAIRH